MEKLIERVAKAPLGVKLGAITGGLLLITLLNLFVMPGRSISEIDSRKKRGDLELKKLNQDLTTKQAIANDLNRFRREKELLQQQLDEAKSELPETKNIDELLQAFQDRAQKAGLEIITIEPKEMGKGDFYARVPIAMQVEGNFHDIATFFDALGRLRRIVNVSDIVFDKPRDVNGRVIVSGSFTATTFMFLDAKAAAAMADKKTKGGR
jgi:type IV pilus assembly protein PilO